MIAHPLTSNPETRRKIRCVIRTTAEWRTVSKTYEDGTASFGTCADSANGIAEVLHRKAPQNPKYLDSKRHFHNFEVWALYERRPYG
jgi:hypothetical protein